MEDLGKVGEGIAPIGITQVGLHVRAIGHFISLFLL
jgi:hypothetical protein